MTDLECIKYWLKKDLEYVDRQEKEGESSPFKDGHTRGRKFQIYSVLDVIEDIEENK